MLNFQEFLGGAQRKLISINRNGESDLPKSKTYQISVVFNFNAISIIVLSFDRFDRDLISPTSLNTQFYIWILIGVLSTF